MYDLGTKALRLTGAGLALGGVILALDFLLNAEAEPTSVVPAPGWSVEVLQAGLFGVDNLEVAANGDLYASLEAAGQVVRVERSGYVVLADRVKHADGLALEGEHFLYVTEEAEDGRILRMDLTGNGQSVVRSFFKPEGMVLTADRRLIVTEDRRGGRVVAVSLDDGSSEVLARGLNRPEGLAVDARGALYIAETGSGQVLRLRDGKMQILIRGLDKPDGISIASDGSVWITEDEKPGRLLRFADGELGVVAAGLWSPQGIAFRAGRVLVAEQGRGRILELTAAAR